MSLPRYVYIMVGVLLILGLMGSAQAQTPQTPQAPQAPQTAEPPKNKCGPDHAILYKRALAVLDKAEKKLTTGYTAEAKSLAKEAKSYFSILQKECGQDQKERLLNEREMQQETINQKLAADEQSAGDRLEKSAAEKFKKAEQLEATQPEMYLKLMRESKAENEQAQKRNVKAMIYSLRTQQMLFGFLGR